MFGRETFKERLYEVVTEAFDAADENDLNDDALIDLIVVEVLDAVKEADPEELGAEGGPEEEEDGSVPY